MADVEVKGSNIPLLRPLLDNGLKLDSRRVNDALPIDRPFPVFTTTYCDADVRVSRDVDDNLYVYTKESDDTSLVFPTTTSTRIWGSRSRSGARWESRRGA